MNRPATLALWAALGAVLPACGLNQEGVLPEDDTISFPSAARLDPTGRWLFFVNSNADLRYNDGTTMVLDTARAAADRNESPTPFADCPSTTRGLPRSEEPSCCWDRLDRDILNCDERRYIRPERTVRMGSFAAGMVLQRFCPSIGISRVCPCDENLENPPSRLLIAVRGDTSLTVIDLEPPPEADGPPVLRCTGQPGEMPDPFLTCDEAHRIVETERTASGDPIRLPDEPYALALDYARSLLFVGHLTGDVNRPTSGGVSVFDVSTRDTLLPAPTYLGPLWRPFAGNANGLVGVTSLTWDPTWPNSNQVYATSRYLAAATGISVINSETCGGKAVVLTPGTSYGTNLTGEQTRGIQQVNGRVFLLQRNPPALVGFTGTTPAEVLETCASPTYLYKHDAGAGLRLYVSCQESGEVYVYDPSVPRIERVFQVGRGPAGLEFSDPASGPPVAYVVGFADNNFSVVDLQPGSPTEYHVVQRIGFPSTTPRPAR